MDDDEDDEEDEEEEADTSAPTFDFSLSFPWVSNNRVSSAPSATTGGREGRGVGGRLAGTTTSSSSTAKEFWRPPNPWLTEEEPLDD